MSSTPGASAASTAGDDAMCSTTSARAAITEGAHAMCSITWSRCHRRSWYEVLYHAQVI